MAAKAQRINEMAKMKAENIVAKMKMKSAKEMPNGENKGEKSAVKKTTKWNENSEESNRSGGGMKASNNAENNERSGGGEMAANGEEAAMA